MENLRRIKTLLIFLRSGKPSLDEILKFVALDTLFEFAVLGVLFAEVHRDGMVRIPSGYGWDPDLLRTIPGRPVSIDTLPHRYLRTGEIGECGAMTDFEFATPVFIQTAFPEGFEYSFSWPIQGIGSVVTFCSRASELTIENSEFLTVVGSILSFVLNRMRSDGEAAKVEPAENKTAEFLLTLRQWEVLAGIRSGKANADIANDLGFSESLIRQETVKIYQKLGVTGRSEIAARYPDSSPQNT